MGRLSLATLACLAISGIAALTASAQTFTGSQQRISQQGTDGDSTRNANQTASAFNPTTGEYLVVWRGDDDAPLANDEFEVFGRLVSAGGVPKGSDFRISQVGIDGDPTHGVSLPDVAYNAPANEFVVVWQGDNNTVGLADNELEIWGQRISATGVEVGSNDFRISDMGPDNNAAFDARFPGIACNSTTGQCLVVWSGDDSAAPLIQDEVEIFGQLLDGAGAPLGANDFRISDMGPDMDTSFSASDPDVDSDPATSEYMVSWHGDDDTGSLDADEIEVFGQRLGGDGASLGVNDFRISDMGPDGDTEFVGSDSAVAFNPTANEYLVTWRGNSDFPLDTDENEIFGQRLSVAGAEVGANDFRISRMGPDGFGFFTALTPAVAANPGENNYLVTWHGDDNTAPLVDEEREVFGQRLSAAGEEIGDDDFRISQMGPDGDTGFSGTDSAVVFGDGEFLVAWTGNDPAAGLDPVEDEIYGRAIAGADPDPDPGPTDNEVTLVIGGKRLVLKPDRTTEVRLTCPPAEASPPCAGRLSLRTRKKVEVAAKRRVTLARKRYSLGAGETKKLKLKLSKRSARLIRTSRASRKVVAKTTVGDAAGNSAKISKKMTLAPKKKRS